MKFKPDSAPRVLALTAPDGSHVIECYELASFEFVGYVAAFDPDFADRGLVDLTDEIVDALRFKDSSAAFEAWRMQSASFPVRPDGKPNRPLTAYSAQIVKVS